MKKSLIIFFVSTLVFPSLVYSASFKLFSTHTADLYLDTNSIKREKARRDSINCYLRERKKISDGGTTCIYKCPSVKGRVESNSIGPGFSCPTMMNVLRRE